MMIEDSALARPRLAASHFTGGTEESEADDGPVVLELTCCRKMELMVLRAVVFAAMFQLTRGQLPAACSNLCPYAHDHECDDGSSGGTAYCPSGTDSADCGTLNCFARSTSTCAALATSTLAHPACVNVERHVAESVGTLSANEACSPACAELWLSACNYCGGTDRVLAAANSDAKSGVNDVSNADLFAAAFESSAAAGVAAACAATAGETLATAPRTITVSGSCNLDANGEYVLQPVPMNGKPHYATTHRGWHIFWTPHYQERAAWLIGDDADDTLGKIMLISDSETPIGSAIWLDWCNDEDTNVRLQLTPRNFDSVECSAALTALSPRLIGVCTSGYHGTAVVECLDDGGEFSALRGCTVNSCAAFSTTFPTTSAGYTVEAVTATTVPGLGAVACASGYLGTAVVECLADGGEFSALRGCRVQCSDFRLESTVHNCTECSGPGSTDCTAATCASGYSTFMEAGFCCSDFATEASVDVCTACSGSSSTECTAATCASGYATFMEAGFCCNDFAAEASVDVCTACSGSGTAECVAATCASGYSTFMTGGFCCNDFGPEASVETCTTCSGPGVAECTTATCAAGYSTFMEAGFCCNDFSLESTVQTCTECSGPGLAECTVASCASGYATFMEAGFCCNDFATEASVDVCTACSGSGTAECVAATCASGYSTFMTGGFCCNDFESEPSVSVCTACTGSTTGDCTEATCSAGYEPGSFADGVCTPSYCNITGVGAPANGRLGSVCADPDAAWVASGTTCDLTCDEGYYLSGQLTCTLGVWLTTATCISCNISAESVPSVSACMRCAGASINDCSSAICADGYIPGTFSAGTCASCNDAFALVPSVASCTMCSGSVASDCAVAQCAEGFHSYANGTCCANVVEQRVGGGCACSIGYVSAQGCTADQPCPSGTELVPNDDNTAASCVECEVGAVSSFGGMCEDCDPGRVPNVARSACEDCPAGWQAGDQSNCTQCPVGSVRSTELQCAQCGIGQVQNDAQSACVACAAGSAPVADRSACISCTGTTYSGFGIDCVSCDPPSVVNSDRTTCSACPAGRGPSQDRTECVS
eukprot:COSAG03_NODE_1641_length_3728_cov_3.039129_2_plen_1062_part_01